MLNEPHMGVSICYLTETLHAVGKFAIERFFSCMGSHVVKEFDLAPKESLASIVVADYDYILFALKLEDTIVLVRCLVAFVFSRSIIFTSWHYCDLLTLDPHLLS